MNATFAPRFRLGPYELLLNLASGGMASVILARHRGAAGFERLVVVKRVHRRHLDNKEFTNMFRDEARLASSIRHSNVASVVDVIENDGELCLVMDYFESLSLANLALAANERERRISPAVASRILSDTLVGLHAAHEAVDIRRTRLGIVHRDVSPQNVIVDIGGVSRVIDFGIAKAETRITHTKSGFVKGKLGYMSPEQIEAVPLDRRSDLFSAGIVLHELLTGERLFSGADEFETMRRVLRGEVPDPSKASPEIGPELDAVVRKALARAPGDRFQTGIAFQEALERAAAPAPAHEVGALVAELGKKVLDARHDQLLAMLGEELEKLSPRVPWETTKGHTLPLRQVNPVGPTLRVLPSAGAGEAAPMTTLKSAEDAQLEGAVSGARTSPKSSVASLAAALVVALGIGLVVTFFAVRPAPAPAPAEAASPATVPIPVVSSVAVTSDASGNASGVSARRDPASSASSPEPSPAVAPAIPHTAPGVPRPKPAASAARPPLLQPNPYDDPK